jgi:hypothetical protein
MEKNITKDVLKGIDIDKVSKEIDKYFSEKSMSDKSEKSMESSEKPKAKETKAKETKAKETKATKKSKKDSEGTNRTLSISTESTESD